MKTSAPDVYAYGGIDGKDRELKPHMSITVKAGSMLAVRLFRTRDTREPFSAELQLTPLQPGRPHSLPEPSSPRAS